MNITKFLPYVLLVIALVFGGYQFKEHHDTKAAYKQLDNKYNALKNNSKTKVQNDSTNFLKAFYTYDDRPKKENITGLVTKELQDTLFQTYDALDKEFEMPKIEYKSDIENITIYHARDEYEKNAKVLATFDSVVTIDTNKSNAKTLAELELELKDNKWTVTKYQVLNDVSNFEGN